MSTVRRVQDWTNRNIFTESFDAVNDISSLPSSYQHSPYNNGGNAPLNSIEEETPPPGGNNVAASEEGDPEGMDGKSITALQAVW